MPHQQQQQKKNHCTLFPLLLNALLSLPLPQTAALKLLRSFEKYVWKGSSALSEHAAGQCLNK